MIKLLQLKSRNIKLVVMQLVFVCLAGSVFSENTISFGSYTVSPLEEFTVKIDVANSDNFVAFQVDIPLPKGFSYVNNSAQLIADRIKGHQLTASVVGDSILKILAYHITNEPFVGNSGNLITFHLKAPNTSCTRILSVDTALLSNAGLENILTSVTNGTVKVTTSDIHIVSDLAFGDVSILESKTKAMRIWNYGQRVLNITDIVFESEYFIHNETFPLQIESSDYYDLDITFVKGSKGEENASVSFFSNDPDENPYQKQLSANAYVPNYLNVLSQAVCLNHSQNIEIEIINAEDFVAFQFDLSYPKGLIPDIGQIALTGRKTDHVITASNIAEDTLRIIAYSPEQQSFLGESGAVLQIPCTIDSTLIGSKPLTLSNVIISNSLSENILWGQNDGTVSVFQSQTISFGSLPTKTYGDAAFEITATASSGLPIVYQSSDTNVAVVSGNMITIVGAGETNITASQDGDEVYCGVSENQVFTVEKVMLQVTAGDKTKIYGEENPDLTYLITGFVNGDMLSDIDTLPKIYTTATIASSVDDYAIIVENANDKNYDFTYRNGNLEVQKAVLQVTADNKTKTYGEENPDLTYSVTGFMNGDTQSDIDISPKISTTATILSSSGNYDIIVENASDNNYNFTYRKGILEILPANNVIKVISQTVAYGETANIEIEIENPEPFVAFQFDLHFPQGVTINTSDVVYTERVTDHTSSAIIVNDTILRVLVFSLSQQEFSGNSGPIMIIPMKTNDLQPGGYDLVLMDVINTNANSQNVPITVSNGTLTIPKFPQSLSVDLNLVKTYGDESFRLPMVASSELIVTYESSNPETAIISGNKVTVVGPGQTIIFASQIGSDVYLPLDTVEIILWVRKAPLLFTADDKKKQKGDQNPILTYTVSGFVNGDTVSDIDELPVLHCGANEHTPAGTYSIFFVGGYDNNYEFMTQPGVLTIEAKTGIIESAKEKESVAIYPNPAKDLFYIDIVGFENENAQISVVIYDVVGKMVEEYRNISANSAINIANLKSGIYYIQIKTNDNKIIVKKLVKSIHN